jgi:hypothetical protein
MIAPASQADWLQGLTMTALLAGVAVASPGRSGSTSRRSMRS